MPTSLITRAEDRYVFGISRVVWQLIVCIGAIGALLGLLLLAWAVIPAMKKGVKKDAYPPIVQVQSDEILTRLNKASGGETEYTKPTASRQEQPEGSSKEVEEFSVALGYYQNALDSLKRLFPSDTYNWDDKYQTVTRQDYWRGTYTEQVLEKRGLGRLLDAAINELSVTSHDSAAQLILAYTAPISLFPIDKREAPFQALIQNSHRNVAFMTESARVLATAIPHFDVDNPWFFWSLADFASRNPRDGRRFIQFASQTVDSFALAIRPDILATLTNAYYDALGQSLDEQINATASYMSMRSRFTPEQQAAALKEYYSLYKSKNSERKRVIERVERDYSIAQAEAEAKYQADKIAKLQMRIKGLKGLGLGIGLVAVIAILLALLSIQRSVRHLEQKLPSSS